LCQVIRDGLDAQPFVRRKHSEHAGQRTVEPDALVTCASRITQRADVGNAHAKTSFDTAIMMMLPEAMALPKLPPGATIRFEGSRSAHSHPILVFSDVP
jgi:hypothetical protein